ncbi:hypothetical protein HOY82DRAFT_483035, partial [Tuber indicum]
STKRPSSRSSTTRPSTKRPPSRSSTPRPSIPQAPTPHPAPTSFPTVDEDAVAPTDAAPVMTTHGFVTATIDDSPVTLAYSGEVVPLQTLADHRPAPISFKPAALAALASDDETKLFGELLALEPSVFESLEDGKEYYIFAPTTQFVLEFLGEHRDDQQWLARRNVLVDPYISQQFAEKPVGAPDIKDAPCILETRLVGETKYVDLGPGEAALVVSNPVPGGDGTVEITSGFGNSTLVHAEDIPFEGGVIKKCEGFFTLPRVLETVLGGTQGRIWSTALEKANMLKELSEEGMVTMFAVGDDKLDETKPLEPADLDKLIYKGLLYEPNLIDGDCLKTRGGGSLSIVRNGDDIYVNDALVTKTDVISKNCVIHYLEEMPKYGTCISSSASSTAVVPKVAVFGLSVASLAVCLLM